jgi:hypothetical protein
MCDRQAGGVIGERKRHGDLAIVLLAQLTAILPRNAYGMFALLGNASVVDDPGADGSCALDRRQNQFLHLAHHRFVGPRRLADEMQ